MTSTFPTSITSVTVPAVNPPNGMGPIGDSATQLPISARLRQRLQEANAPFLANDNISAHLRAGEMDQLEAEVTDKVRELLRSLVIDIENDHNTAETAERVARMYLQEVFKGRYQEQPKIASFPNVKKPTEIYSFCPVFYHSLKLSYNRMVSLEV